jgi:hypothetical protein
MDAKALPTAVVIVCRGAEGDLTLGADEVEVLEGVRRGMLGRGLDTERNDMVSFEESWGKRRSCLGFKGAGIGDVGSA